MTPTGVFLPLVGVIAETARVSNLGWLMGLGCPIPNPIVFLCQFVIPIVTGY